MLYISSIDLCLYCNQREDRIHIIRLPYVEKEQKQWSTLIRKQTKALKNLPEQFCNDTTVLIKDIEQYMKGNNNVLGSQNFIGFKIFFLGML